MEQLSIDDIKEIIRDSLTIETETEYDGYIKISIKLDGDEISSDTIKVK